jgi:hypothetical protein
VETGANVPSDSGGLAVWWWFRMRDAGIFCSWVSGFENRAKWEREESGRRDVGVPGGR